MILKSPSLHGSERFVAKKRTSFQRNLCTSVHTGSAGTIRRDIAVSEKTHRSPSSEQNVSRSPKY